MSILALSTHYGAGALIYPPFHALASSEGQEGLTGDALEGGPELESSRESRADPADTSFPAWPMLPMTAPAATAGLFGDGEWPGADMGCGGIPNPENTWVLQGRSCPSLPPAGGCACAGAAVPGDAACAGASLHPVLPHGDVPVQSGPTDVPLSPIPLCHPQGHIPVCRPCGWRDNTAPNDGQAAGQGCTWGYFLPPWMLGSCFPAVSVAAGLWDRGWHTCDTAITASPASCCLS